MKKYLSSLWFADGVITVRHTESDRTKRISDLWCRLRLFAWSMRQGRPYKRPFRFIKAVLASATMACTFDKKLRQEYEASSGPTSKVGKEAESGVSPRSGETSTRCDLPQSGHGIEDSSRLSDKHNFSI